MITQEQLQAIFRYEPETGYFFYLEANGTQKAGAQAGALDNQGYVILTIKRKKYKAHRLAWLYVHGEIPDSEIDHINVIKSDNRLSNLRPASRSQQEMNKAIQRNNTSGYKGVTLHKKDKKWDARIQVNGRTMKLGRFETAEAANAAYCKAANFFHGDFANVG